MFILIFWAPVHIKTRMTKFIKTKFKKSNDPTNIDNYRVAANITEYQHKKNKLGLSGSESNLM